MERGPILHRDALAGRGRIVGDQPAAVTGAVGAAAPQVDFAEHLIGLADVHDQWAGVEDLVADVV